jgi:hypothetical protein
MRLRPDCFRSRLGHPLSDILVDTGPVKQHAPSTYFPPSHAHPGQWIRSYTRGYTLQGVAFLNSNLFPRQLPRHHFQIKKIVTQPQYLTDRDYHVNCKKPSTGTAHHVAPHRASGRSCPPPPRSYRLWSCAANTRNLPQTHFVNMSSTRHSVWRLL